MWATSRSPESEFSHGLQNELAPPCTFMLTQ
jgi:hypothetical protein